MCILYVGEHNILIEFSVKNFLSFKDKVTLSMEKGNGEEIFKANHHTSVYKILMAINDFNNL